MKSECEHMTPFIWEKPDRFKLANDSNSLDIIKPRWTVDEKEDSEFMAIIDGGLYYHHTDKGWIYI